MTPVEKLQAALELKEEGNDLFKRTKIEQAITKYKEVKRKQIIALYDDHVNNGVRGKQQKVL